MGILRELQDYLEVLARIEGVFLIYLGVMEGILGIMVFSVEYLLLLLYLNHWRLLQVQGSSWRLGARKICSSRTNFFAHEMVRDTLLYMAT